MKNIRLKYHRDTGIRVQPEMNLVQDYTKENAYGHDIHVFPNLYDYINWLEDQLDPISKKPIDAAKAAEVLRIALMKL